MQLALADRSDRFPTSRPELPRAAGLDLAAVLDAIDAGVLFSEGDDCLGYVNQSAERLLDLPAARLLTMTRFQLLRELRGRTTRPTAVDAMLSREPPRIGVQSTDLELAFPTRRVVRWSSRTLRLPSGAGRIDMLTDVTAEVDLAAERERLATTDVLTGLANRRAGEDALRRAVAQATRHGNALSIALLDIDHFKRVNDAFGHLAGDDVLRTVAQVAAGAARGTDLVVRWGGEELLVLLPDTGHEGALSLADRLRHHIAAAVATPDGRPVTVSAGVATFDRGLTLNALLAQADVQLYAAKDAGRNQVR